MTANNMITVRDRIYFLTDTAIYDPNGVVQEFGSKVIAVPNLKAALMMRGPMENAFFVGMALEAVGQGIGMDPLATQDELKDFVMEAVRQSTLKWHRTPINVTLGFYAEERKRFEGYVAFTDPKGDYFSHLKPGQSGYGMRDFEWYQAPLDAIAPAPSPDAMAAAMGGMMQGMTRDQFDPRRHGLALLEAQRATRDSQGRYVVGGSAQLTTITTEGVTSEVLRQWPDRVGHKIDPRHAWDAFKDAAAEALDRIADQAVVNAENRLNRKQRRAMAAASRR